MGVVAFSDFLGGAKVAYRVHHDHIELAGLGESLPFEARHVCLDGDAPLWHLPFLLCCALLGSGTRANFRFFFFKERTNILLLIDVLGVGLFLQLRNRLVHLLDAQHQILRGGD